MALLDKTIGQRYDTPPGGDFVRYVEQLLARQPSAAQTMVVTDGLRPAVRKPASGGSSPGREAAVVRPATSASGGTAATAATATTVTTKASELLDRIRQLEEARKSGASASAAPARVFATQGNTQTPDGAGGAKLFTWAAAMVLSVVFPPVGLLMLAGLLKKAFGNKAK